MSATLTVMTHIDPGTSTTVMRHWHRCLMWMGREQRTKAYLMWMGRKKSTNGWLIWRKKGVMMMWLWVDTEWGPGSDGKLPETV